MNRAKLEFEYLNRIQRLNLEKINIFFGGSLSGKTSLSCYLEEIFSGLIKTAYFNNQVIDKKQFFVKKILLNQNFSDEIKFGSKTELHKKLKMVLSDMDSDEICGINQKMQEALLPLTERIESEFGFLSKYYNQIVNNDFYFDDWIGIVKNHHQLFNKNIQSTSLSKIALISLVLKFVDNQKESIIIIDDFDSNLDLTQMIQLLDCFEKIDNCYSFLFTKSIELCSLLENRKNIYLMNYQLITFQGFIQSYINSLDLEYSKNLLYPGLIENELLEIELSLKNYFIHFLLMFISSKDKAVIIDFFEKNKNLDDNIKNFIRKFEEKKIDSL